LLGLVQALGLLAKKIWIFRAFGEPGLNHRTGTPLEQEEE
jgi:hypothetical protein